MQHLINKLQHQNPKFIIKKSKVASEPKILILNDQTSRRYDQGTLKSIERREKKTPEIYPNYEIAEGRAYLTKRYKRSQKRE